MTLGTTGQEGGGGLGRAEKIQKGLRKRGLHLPDGGKGEGEKDSRRIDGAHSAPYPAGCDVINVDPLRAFRAVAYYSIHEAGRGL